jgi:hypothetical protein
MVPPLFCYHLGLAALVGVFLLLGVLWPRKATAERPPSGPSTPPRRQRSPAPKVVAGLPTKPPGARCARAAVPPQPVPPAPPAPLPPPQCRPRTGATSQPFWPHTGRRERGWRGLGTRRAHGHPPGSPWRPCPCPAGAGSLPAPHSPLCHGQQGAGERIGRGVAWLAKGRGRRATARGCEVAPHPVLRGRSRRPSPDVPLPRIASGRFPWRSANSRRCLPGCVVSQLARSAQRTPASGLSRLASGGGRPSIPTAHGWWLSIVARGPWQWRRAACLRARRGWPPAVCRCFEPTGAGPL